MFVYEGRTSSILSTTSSANAYSTFNPMISHSFGENYFGGVGAMDEPDDLASLSAASQPRLSPDELQYLQLLAAVQQDTREEPSYLTPALVVNRAGATETSGTNWLLPVAAKDSYEHFFASSLNTHSFLAFPAAQPAQTRLYALGRPPMCRRGRVARGRRILLDRVREPRPLYGDASREVYRSCLPMAAVRKHFCARRSDGGGAPSAVQGVGLPGIALPSQNVAYGAPAPFGRFNASCATGVKRSYEEVMQDENVELYVNLEENLKFNLANEMSVRVEPVKRMILNRNTANDQIQFIL